MEKLAVKGYMKAQQVKGRLMKPFSNRRGDDNGQTGARSVGGILGLVILLGAIFGFIALVIVAYKNGMDSVTTWFGKFKGLEFPTTP